MSPRDAGGEAPTLEGRIDELRRVVSLLEHKMSDEFDLELDRSIGTVRYLDAILVETRNSGRELKPSLFLSIGGYLGETLIETSGGRWTEDDGNLAVTLEGEMHQRTVNVFDWVKQAYANPSEQSLGHRVRMLFGDGVEPAAWGTETEPDA